MTAICSTQFISLHLRLIIYAFLRIAAHISNIYLQIREMCQRECTIFSWPLPMRSAIGDIFSKEFISGAKESAPDE